VYEALRSERALEGCDRVAGALPRRVQLAELLLHDAEVGERDRDVGVLWSVDGLLDRERALQGHPRRLKVPEVLLHDAEAGECERDLGMLAP
jgi:hypothetical protein